MKGHFIYCKETCGKPLKDKMIAYGYTLYELDERQETFWNAINQLRKSDKLVIFSHGNKEGPLMVEGQSGRDMTDDEIAKLGETVKSKEIDFYCVSCNTGKLRDSDKYEKNTETNHQKNANNKRARFVVDNDVLIAKKEIRKANLQRNYAN